MILTIHLDSPVPLGEQVQEGIRQAIATGQLAPGDPLPPVRQLAADLGINLNTVARAYRALEAAGLVRTLRGRGTRVTASVEISRGPDGAARSRLATRVRACLTDARLAAMDRSSIETLFATELAAFWPEE